MTTLPQAEPQFTAHLVDCTNTILRELDTKTTQKAIAQTYALAMQSRHPTEWGVVNRAIIARWSESGLQRVKQMAHSGRCWR